MWGLRKAGTWRACVCPSLYRCSRASGFGESKQVAVGCNPQRRVAMAAGTCRCTLEHETHRYWSAEIGGACTRSSPVAQSHPVQKIIRWGHRNRPCNKSNALKGLLIYFCRSSTEAAICLQFRLQNPFSIFQYVVAVLGLSGRFEVLFTKKKACEIDPCLFLVFLGSSSKLLILTAFSLLAFCWSRCSLAFLDAQT